MSRLKIKVGQQNFELDPGQPFTFGRDASCIVCLDPTDQGISRIAGSIGYESGIWWIVNRSTKRTLHVVGDLGITVPVPVATPSGVSRRAVDQPDLTVLVVGSVFRHAIVLNSAVPTGPPTLADPTDPLSTITSRVKITVGQREALVAMVSGYLQPFPRYNPHPLNYQAVADKLGVTKKAVVRRITMFRETVADTAEIPGLRDSNDARRPLAEWALFTRLVDVDDVAWLEDRLRQPRPPAADACD